MKILAVGEFKSRFSEVVQWVKQGEEVSVTYGRAKEIIGYFIPKMKKRRKRQLGKYTKMKGYWMSPDFRVTTEDEFPLG